MTRYFHCRWRTSNPNAIIFSDIEFGRQFLQEGSWSEGVRQPCDVTDDISASRAARSQESFLFGVKHAAIGVAVYFAVAALALGAALTGLYWLILAILFIASW